MKYISNITEETFSGNILIKWYIIHISCTMPYIYICVCVCLSYIIYIIYIYKYMYDIKFVQVRRDWANKITEFSQLVSAMRLFSGEFLKFVQIALLYKLGVIYLKDISSELSVPSTKKITLVYMYQKGR